MTDEYRLVTTRTGDGSYTSKLTYAGKGFFEGDWDKFSLSEDLRSLIAEINLRNIEFLGDHKNINRLEIIISGEGLK